MSRNNLPAGWRPEEHPPMDLLRQYQNNELPADLRHQLERHLLSCELCSDLLDGMALARPSRVKTAVRETRGRLKNLLAQKKRKRKTFQWPAWQTAAVLLVLIFAIGEVIYHHYFARPHHHFGQAPVSVPTWQLSGQVLGVDGITLAGAVVQVKDDTTQTTTSDSGLFRLNVPQEKGFLLVSYPGYVPKEIYFNQAQQLLKIYLVKAD